VFVFSDQKLRVDEEQAQGEKQRDRALIKQEGINEHEKRRDKTTPT
jgi:hypothetical protein